MSMPTSENPRLTVDPSPLQRDFLESCYDARQGSARQQEFRRLAPMPFGVVLIARDEMDETTIRQHLQTMRELGFNAIKQFMPCRRWSNPELERLALEEGLCPWWYGEGGWEPIDGELLQRLGLPADISPADARSHPRMLEHQREVLARRIGRPKIPLNLEAQEGFPGMPNKAALYTNDAHLPDELAPGFIEWLQVRYAGDLALLHRAWNEDVVNATQPYLSWQEVVERHEVNVAREYGRVRDLLRYKADRKSALVRELSRRALERDPHEPVRSGGEMGIFLPFASRGTDMEGIAGALREAGSFYPSIHLAWHFEETHFEVARPVYMQAAMVVDWNKGGWTAPWESTGGPQQLSGGKAHLYPWVEDELAGFTVDAGVMTQLLLSYLAAGCKGAGLWAWNARQAGFEAGEYALLDRNEKVCARTIQSGQIARAANRWRDELWAARRQPQVGILVDWDNEAIWAAISQRSRTILKYRGVEGRIGAARTCIDACLPFEHVTGNDLRAGLAARYPVIYLPCVIGLGRDLLDLLSGYVNHGGRLVMDMPGGAYDETGRVLPTAAGTPFERLFGCAMRDLQYSGNNARWILQGSLREGFVADLLPTSAEVLQRWENGLPAVMENRLGLGSAVLLDWEAARACYRPGQTRAQAELAGWLLGGQLPIYQTTGGVAVHRLAAPQADHYFLIHDGEATETRFTRVPYDYLAVEDVLSGERLDLNRPVAVAANHGRWLRCTLP